MGFVFPKGEVPPPLPSSSPFGALKGVEVSTEDFEKLTAIPILMLFGDHIPEKPSPHGGEDNWRVRLKEARLMADAINRRGGDAKVLHLPEIGIYGNTHFLFEDKNNEDIADIMDRWIQEKGLGEYGLDIREALIKPLSDFILVFLFNARNQSTRIASYLRRLMTQYWIKIHMKFDSAN